MGVGGPAPADGQGLEDHREIVRGELRVVGAENTVISRLKVVVAWSGNGTSQRMYRENVCGCGSVGAVANLPVPIHVISLDPVPPQASRLLARPIGAATHVFHAVPKALLMVFGKDASQCFYMIGSISVAIHSPIPAAQGRGRQMMHSSMTPTSVHG